MNRTTIFLAAAIVAGAITAPVSAFAADATIAAAPAAPDLVTYPYVEGTFNLQLDNDWIFHSNHPGTEINNFYLHADTAAFKFGLTRIFSVNLGLTLEQVKGPFAPDDCTMCGIGLYMDTLDLQADVGNWTLTAGKYEPAFGFAWDVTPGVWGSRYAEEYELTERMALGAAYTFDTGFGKHTLAVNTFFADTTVFSQSLFNDRGRVHDSDGGAGNTGTFNNFSVTLAGEDMPGLSGFKYNVGYRHQEAGAGDAGDENGFVLGLSKDTDIGHEMTLGLIGEVAYFEHYTGASADATYVTVGASLKRSHGHGELTGSFRDFETNDHLLQASAGYTFDSGYDVSLGYGYERVGVDHNDMIGLRLTKCFSFSSRGKGKALEC